MQRLDHRTKKRTSQGHVATGAAARRLKQWVVSSNDVVEGEEVFYLAQALSFLIHDSSASSLSQSLLLPRNKFAIRKLRSALSLLESVFLP